MPKAISAVRTDITSVVKQYAVNIYEGKVTKDDPSDAMRLVGFAEYRQALKNFDALLKTASAEELRAMDEYVKERPEFAFYSNLSKLIEGQPGSLSEPANPLGFRQHGFAWVVALARVEFAAMLAAFVDVDQAFRSVQPSDYEMPAYRELVLDGFRTHAWALKNDAELNNILRDKSRNSRLLAYFRRALLTQRFAEAARQALGTQITPEQTLELASWQKQIKNIKLQIAKNVKNRLDALNATEGGSQTTTLGKSTSRIVPK